MFNFSFMLVLTGTVSIWKDSRALLLGTVLSSGPYLDCMCDLSIQSYNHKLAEDYDFTHLTFQFLAQTAWYQFSKTTESYMSAMYLRA